MMNFFLSLNNLLFVSSHISFGSTGLKFCLLSLRVKKLLHSGISFCMKTNAVNDR